MVQSLAALPGRRPSLLLLRPRLRPHHQIAILRLLRLLLLFRLRLLCPRPRRAGRGARAC